MPRPRRPGPTPSTPAWGEGETVVLRRLESYRRRDYSYGLGQILGSMCTTPHPLAEEAHVLFLETNLGDPGHFPGTQALEAEYVRLLLSLCGARRRDGAGQVTSGGSEANILALALLREATGKSEVIVPRTGHFSFEKAAKLMQMRLRIADVDEAYRVRPEHVQELIGPETAGVIGVAGSTQVGSVDPIRELGAIAQAHGVRLHVDAAFGGYVLPFLRPPRPFGFDVAGVASVTIDSHKMGMGTMGAGALLVRHAKDLETLAVETPYLSTPRQRGVLGTRTGAPVASAWSLLKALGHRGYARVVEGCLQATRHFLSLLREQGLAPLIPPELNIVAVPCPRPYRVQELLSRQGWRVNVLPRLGGVRVVVMPHVTPEILDTFTPALARAIRQVPGEPVHAKKVTASVAH